MASHSEELDAEGIPDLDDSLPEKEITGDAQEGLIPPSDRKLAPDDFYARDTLDQRLREEVPDRIIEQDEEAPRLMDSSSDDFEDRIAAETETGDEGGAMSAEESAIHVTDEPPGVVDDDRDSYTGEPIP